MNLKCIMRIAKQRIIIHICNIKHLQKYVFYLYKNHNCIKIIYY